MKKNEENLLFIIFEEETNDMMKLHFQTGDLGTVSGRR